MSELETLDSTAEVKVWQAPRHRAGSAGPLTATRLAAIEEQAYAEGLARGLEEGRRIGERDVALQARRLEELIAQIAPGTALVDEAFLSQVGDLVLSIARQFVRRGLAWEPGEVVRVIREALAALPVTSSTIRISLHPEDAAFVRERVNPETLAQSVRIVEDLGMSRGGARIETDVSVVDASVEARFGAIAASILGDERNERAPAAGKDVGPATGRPPT